MTMRINWFIKARESLLVKQNIRNFAKTKAKAMKNYRGFVYIMASKRNGTLYIGVTNDLARRVAEHKAGVNRGFTSRYGVKTLVYYECFAAFGHAVAREKQLKEWNRAWKISLIEDMNPSWHDLAADIGVTEGMVNLIRIKYDIMTQC